jgi:hypothetical protein
MGEQASASNTKNRGDETEAKIIATLLEHGFTVSLPFGDNDKYDLIVDDSGSLYRVQCKTAWQNKPNTIRFNTHSQTTRERTYHEETYHDEVDAFIIRYPEDDSIYWIDIQNATSQKMELRFRAEIDHPSINWAHEYTFEGEIT